MTIVDVFMWLILAPLGLLLLSVVVNLLREIWKDSYNREILFGLLSLFWLAVVGILSLFLVRYGIVTVF